MGGLTPYFAELLPKYLLLSAGCNECMKKSMHCARRHTRIMHTHARKQGSAFMGAHLKKRQRPGSSLGLLQAKNWRPGFAAVYDSEHEQARVAAWTNADQMRVRRAAAWGLALERAGSAAGENLGCGGP